MNEDDVDYNVIIDTAVDHYSMNATTALRYDRVNAKKNVSGGTC